MENDSRNAQASKAFQNRDVDQSKLAHLLPAHKEETNEEGKFLKPIVFGGLDGISTIFAFVAGALGADLGLSHIIAIGCAQLFAGALGMGFGEYLSAKAERAVAEREQAREKWEVENNPQGEVEEMVQIYVDKGLSPEDARVVANTLSKYEDFWVEHMMLHEIGMFPPEEDDWANVLQGVVMFLSFLILGGIPLVAYILADFLSDSESVRASAAYVSSSVALFLLGCIKAHMSGVAQAWSGMRCTELCDLLKAGVTMMVQGLLCAGGAYLIGDSLPKLFNLGD
jgi:DNA damage-binding protein 1